MKFTKKLFIYTADSGRRMEITAANNSATFYDTENRRLTSLQDDVESFIDDDSGNTQRTLSGITFNKFYSSNPGNPDIVRITGNGIYSNTGYVSALSSNNFDGSTAWGAIVGYVRRYMKLAYNHIHAAVVGLANTSNSYGGYFKHMQGGVALRVDGKIQTIDSNSNVLTGKTGYVCWYNNGSPAANGYYFGAKIVNGLIVEVGSYNSNTQPLILS